MTSPRPPRLPGIPRPQSSPAIVTSFAGERFELLACIGRGATGGVYRARTTDSPFGFAREVCIKRLSGQLSPEAGRAMREEARLLASVRHANVVSLLAMGHEPNGAPFLVLELIDGADLRVLTKAVARQSDPAQPGPAGVLPDRVAVYVACGLVRALGAVQRAIPGLVHRDVTPHNVLLSREGEVKLSDFGIALALDRARWTRSSVVKGKFGYMAPEQIRGEALDVRTDLFGVGVVLFELLARRRPWFAPQDSMDELRAIERGEIASLLECRPRIDPVLAMAVDRLLALDKRDRFDGCDAALRALASFSAGDSGSLRVSSIIEVLVPRRPPIVLSSPSEPRKHEATRSAPAPSGPVGARFVERTEATERAEEERACDLVAYEPSPASADLP